jgi:hypothetical protein
MSEYQCDVIYRLGFIVRTSKNWKFALKSKLQTFQFCVECEENDHLPPFDFVLSTMGAITFSFFASWSFCAFCCGCYRACFHIHHCIKLMALVSFSTLALANHFGIANMFCTFDKLRQGFRSWPFTNLSIQGFCSIPMHFGNQTM